MRKKISYLLAVVFLTLTIAGCTDTANSQTIDTSTAPDNNSSDITIIKWCCDGEVEELSRKINEWLTIQGSELRVEMVGFDTSDPSNPYVTFNDLVGPYEEENGSFDIVSLGGEWDAKSGSMHTLMENGYFRELSESDIASFTDVPKILWEAAKIKGKHYAVPSLSSTNNLPGGIRFIFNTNYVSPDKLEDFNCTLPELENLLKEIEGSDTFHIIHYNMDYPYFFRYVPATNKGNIYISHETKRAFNPYEREEVIRYAHELNSLYTKGYFNYYVDFSGYSDEMEYFDLDKMNFAVCVVSGIEFENEDAISFTTPYYIENRLSGSTGIPTGSAHPKEAMELLKKVHSDKEFTAVLSEQERAMLGLTWDNAPFVVGNVKLSPLVDFELNYTDIDEFGEVSKLCKDSFDKLCKAEDFDKTLKEINEELKAAGIDDYVDRVNQRLEEFYGASSQ